jgi:homopolymeric O-antigen transport system permease protein
VLASLIIQGIFLMLLLLYIMGVHQAVPWTCIFLPLLMLLQAMAMIGVSYVLAAVGPYFRDVKDLVQVFNTVGLYLMPILYLPELVPAVCRPLLYVNPLSYLVWCYQDALYFGRFEHPWAWPALVFMSVGVFVTGYRLFRTLKVMFGNVL